MSVQFHLSLDVRAIDESVAFFERVLRAKVTHRDESGYVNLVLFGCQLTLHQGAPHGEGIHFGANLSREDFDALASHVCATAPEHVVSMPTIVDEGTKLERKKMYVRCPSGYLVELKGL